MDVIFDGQVADPQSLQNVLRKVLQGGMADPTVLRVSCPGQDLHGRILIEDGRYITAAGIANGRETGYSALRKLLMINEGNYAYLLPGRHESVGLDPTFQIGLENLIAHMPNLPPTENGLAQPAHPSVAQMQAAAQERHQPVQEAPWEEQERIQAPVQEQFQAPEERFQAPAQEQFQAPEEQFQAPPSQKTEARPRPSSPLRTRSPELVPQDETQFHGLKAWAVQDLAAKAALSQQQQQQKQDEPEEPQQYSAPPQQKLPSPYAMEEPSLLSLSDDEKQSLRDLALSEEPLLPSEELSAPSATSRGLSGLSAAELDALNRLGTPSADDEVQSRSSDAIRRIGGGRTAVPPPDLSALDNIPTPGQGAGSALRRMPENSSSSTPSLSPSDLSALDNIPVPGSGSRSSLRRMAESSSSSTPSLSASDLDALNNIAAPGSGSSSALRETPENSSSSTPAFSPSDLDALNNIPTPGAGRSAPAPRPAAESSSSSTPALSSSDLSSLNNIPAPGQRTGPKEPLTRPQPQAPTSRDGLSLDDLSALNNIPTPGPNASRPEAPESAPRPTPARPMPPRPAPAPQEIRRPEPQPQISSTNTPSLSNSDLSELSNIATPGAPKPAPQVSSSTSTPGLSNNDLSALKNIPTPGAGGNPRPPVQSSSTQTPQISAPRGGALAPGDLSALNDIPTPGKAGAGTGSSPSNQSLPASDLDALSNIPTPGQSAEPAQRSGSGHAGLSADDLAALSKIPTPKADGPSRLSKEDLDVLNSIPTPKAKTPEPVPAPISKPEPSAQDLPKRESARPAPSMRARQTDGEDARGTAGRGAPSARARGIEQNPQVPWGFIGIVASVLFVLAIGAFVVWKAINTPPEPDTTVQPQPAATQPAPDKGAHKKQPPSTKHPVAKPKGK